MKTPTHMYFPVNIANFLRTPIQKNQHLQTTGSDISNWLFKIPGEKLNEISNSTYQKLNINFKHQFIYKLYW